MSEFNPVIEDQINDPNFPASLSPAFFMNNGCKVLGTMFISSGEGLHPVVLLINGFPGNEVNSDIAHMLQRQGFNVFTFFPRGSWGSGGEYSWKNIVEDNTAAINFLKSKLCTEKFRVDASKIILAGYSMGGFAVLYNSLRYEEIKNVFTIAPFNIGMFGQLLEMNSEVRNLTKQKITSSMEFVTGSSMDGLIDEMIKNKNDWNLINHSKILAEKNLLIVSAKYDSTAPAEIHHKPLVASLNISGAVHMQEHILESGHSFSDKRIQLMTIISNWIKEIKL